MTFTAERCHVANPPLLISKSVIVCHLSMATFQPSSTRRQLKSITSLSLSPPKACRTDCSRSREKEPEGKRNDVTMTYCGRSARVKDRSMAAVPLKSIERKTSYPLGTSLDPLLGVAVFDATAYLQSSRPRCQRLTGCGIVTGAEHDYMSASSVVVPVELCIVRRRVLGCEVCFQIGSGSGQSPTNDLFHGAGVQVYARSEARHPEEWTVGLLDDGRSREFGFTVICIRYVYMDTADGHAYLF